MAETLERPLIGSILQCDVCPRSGVESWARAHAFETGHSVFSVIPD